MVEARYTSQRVSFLRRVVDTLDASVQAEATRLEALNTGALSRDQALALGEGQYQFAIRLPAASR